LVFSAPRRTGRGRAPASAVQRRGGLRASSARHRPTGSARSPRSTRPRRRRRTPVCVCGSAACLSVDVCATPSSTRRHSAVVRLFLPSIYFCQWAGDWEAGRRRATHRDRSSKGECRLRVLSVGGRLRVVQIDALDRAYIYQHASAKSLTVVVLRSGVPADTKPNTSLVVRADASVVSSRPPATRLTRTPDGPSSAARLRVRPTSAACGKAQGSVWARGWVVRVRPTSAAFAAV